MERIIHKSSAIVAIYNIIIDTIYTTLSAEREFIDRIDTSTGRKAFTMRARGGKIIKCQGNSVQHECHKREEKKISTNREMNKVDSIT